MEKLQEEMCVLVLPEILDIVAASTLLEEFLALRGQALSIDAGRVKRLGGQCLQVLLAARAAWVADDHELHLENFSDDFRATIDLLGVDLKTLTYCKELCE